MGSLGYAWDELRRRWGRTVVTALGLAAGVGLVMGIVGVSDGLQNAQADVLSPLKSVGTDILVTRTVGATATSTTNATASPSPSQPTQGQDQQGQGAQGGGFFVGGPGGGGGTGRGGLQDLTQLNADDQAALLAENSSVVTDLSSLGPAGTKYTHDFFVPGTLISFPDAAVKSVASIPGVTSAVGGLTLQAQHQSGTVPTIVASIQTGGQTLSTTVRPAPMTDAERAQVRSCIEALGNNAGGPTVQTSPAPGGGTKGGAGGGFVIKGNPEFEKCLPQRFQEYQANVVVPLQTINQIVNPPKTDTTTSSYTAAGVDPKHPEAGLVTKAQVSQGAWFGSTPSSQVLVNTAYAAKKSLKVGDTLTINDKTFAIAGLVAPTLTGNVSDIYFDLNALQTMATKASRVNEVLVKVKDSSNVDAVAKAIKKQLPGAQVVTTASLANQVTGSLTDARKLADRLGGALAVIVLLAAFVIAVLLTLSSVGKRVREIGTLRAVGWSRRRVVGQITLETLGIGFVGGLLGLLIGTAVCAAVASFGPTLTATSSGVAVGASDVGALFGQTAKAVTTTIPLSAPISITTVLLGLLVALVGGLIAGAAGGWRAARLSPATALRDIG
jgi:ABC-type antimicrobial peptide transport system permease subunit